MSNELWKAAKRHKRFPPGKSSRAPILFIALFYWFANNFMGCDIISYRKGLSKRSLGHVLYDNSSREVVFIVVDTPGLGVGRKLLNYLPVGSWARTDEERGGFYLACGWERIKGQKRYIKVK